MLNPQSLKKLFPIFERRINGNPLVYLDNASTSQKPQAVLDELMHYYTTMNANIHRGVHTLSEEATAAYEGVREKVAAFVGARESAEIIFTRNATESLNLVAYTWGEQNIHEGDEIAVSVLEHHSNLVPWQELCRRKKAVLKILQLTGDMPTVGAHDAGGREDRAHTATKPGNWDLPRGAGFSSGSENGTAAYERSETAGAREFLKGAGNVDVSKLEELIGPKCKLVAITQLSNVLGTITPLEKIIRRAREVGAIVVVDGAQGVPHLGINVRELDCDFLAFSAHKMFGPTGVGVLYGKRGLLEKMPPFLFGGEMVKEVSAQEANWNDVPWKFEAGTPNIGGVIAFGKALDFVNEIGFDEIKKHDARLVAYAREKLAKFPGMEIYGSAESGGVVSFNVPGVHPHDVASILNEAGVAVRAGHHCAQPLMQSLQVTATTRISFSVYNDEADVDAACEAINNVYKIFKI
jgi:cysteine desulfurase/selenocysteine lyase